MSQNVSFIQDNGQLVPVATNIELNSKGFYTIQPISSGGNYQVCLYKEGFEDKNTTIFVDATMDNEIISKVCDGQSCFTRILYYCFPASSL